VHTLDLQELFLNQKGLVRLVEHREAQRSTEITGICFSKEKKKNL
jgi:hypothetical protein